jgi:superfamily II RNA helicase
MNKFNLLPAVFFLKSRSDCNNALYSCKDRFISDTKSRKIKNRLDDLLQDYPFLASHSQLEYLIHHAIGSHHGGQLPHWKIVIEKLMNEGYLDAIFSTSTVAAGVNFPARTVVLAQSDRFNGKEFVNLSPTELHQATGRAGRRGKDKIGFALMLHGPFQDPHLINDLLSQPPDPIKSQIQINFSMCLNLMLSQTPDEIHKLLNFSFATFQNISSLSRLKDKKENMIKSLKQAMHDCGCDNFNDILSRTERRGFIAKRLSRLKKQMKKQIKSCRFSNISIDDDEVIPVIKQEIELLENEINEMPCSHCPKYILCYKKKNNHFIKLVDKTKLISESFEEVKNSLWNEFKRHFNFLVLNGYAEENGSLTSDGIWAAKLRLDHPLIIAESIRKGILNRLTPELLAGIIAIFVNDKFRDIDLNESMDWNRKPLTTAYYMMKDATDEIMSLKKKHGFKVPHIQLWPAAALYTWACGETWENVIKLTSVDEGDLAMLIFRTADNLRQLTSLDETHPVLSDKSRQSLNLLLREPVIIPT